MAISLHKMQLHGCCIHHPGLDICFDEYNYHDSLQACLMLMLFNFRNVLCGNNVPGLLLTDYFVVKSKLQVSILRMKGVG